MTSELRRSAAGETRPTPRQEEARYRQLLQADPGNARAWYDLGVLLHSQGRLDEAGNCYQQALRFQAGWPELHLDLGRLEYLTSTGLALFVTLHQRVRAAGARLSLHNVREPVYDLFAITHLTTILDIRRHEPEGGTAASTA